MNVRRSLMRNFKCGKCGEVSCGSDWESQTMSALASTEVQALSEDVLSGCDGYFYQCPICKDDCFTDDGAISVAE